VDVTNTNVGQARAVKVAATRKTSENVNGLLVKVALMMPRALEKWSVQMVPM
jgi:hypothetical protein